MALGMRLETKLGLKLKLTPQLRQALEILQMPLPKLEQRARVEVEANPLLAWRIPDNVADGRSGPTEGTDFARSTDIDAYDPFERLDAERPSLQAHLEWQVNVAPWSDAIKMLVRQLMVRLTPEGLLRESDRDLATLIGGDEAEIAEARAYLQDLEPTGIGARDLSECLVLQLREQGLGDSVAARIMQEATDEMESGDLAAVAAKLDVDADEVREALLTLRGLDPKPAAAYEHAPVAAIEPELSVEREDGGWKVELHKPLSHKIRRSPVAETLKHHPERFSEEERKYLVKKLRSADLFLEGLRHRELTLLRVAEVVVARNAVVLEQGREYANPLTLKDVARELDVHESTVSRSTRQKYMLTPDGITEVKALFCTPVSGDRTAASVRRALQAVIEAEDPAKPLSDQAICRELAKQEIDIARRTVAKYRAELGIPGRSKRRRPDSLP